ncbi:MAG: hypothetical protein IJM30_02015 [Thermoguttaceae bacterium]|nr:hypothetical protein [Thermoguttaceae bacterium]
MRDRFEDEGCEESIAESLDALGLASFEELFVEFSPEMERRSKELNERFAKRRLSDFAPIADGAPVFVGGGRCDRFVPIAIENMTSRVDLGAARRDKKPRVVRDVLRALVKYRENVARLLRAERVDAFVAVGGSPLIRAISLAVQKTRRSLVALPETLDPEQVELARACAELERFETVVVPERRGVLDLDSLTRLVVERGAELAALVVQYPNFYGALERVSHIAETVRKSGALLLACADPFSLSILRSPIEWGADLIVGGSAPFAKRLGDDLELGFVAGVDSLVRALPPSASKRESAFRSLAANQALAHFAFANPKDLRKAADDSRRLASRARAAFDRAGFRFLHDAPFLSEFAVKVDDPGAVNRYLRKWGIVGGYELDAALLFAFTEKRTAEEVEELVYFMKESRGVRDSFDELPRR